MEKRLVDVNGVKLHVTVHSDEGEALLFLHYLGGSSAIWKSIIPSFADEYKVISMDFRGHGKSEQTDTGYTMESFVEDVKTVLDILHIEKVHIVGSSLGCYVGTYFAAMYPGRVLSLVNSEGALVNHSGEGGLYEETIEEYVSMVFQEPEMEFPTKAALMNFFEENWLPWNDARVAALEDYEPRKLENGNYAFVTKRSTSVELIIDLYNRRLEDWFEKVECPVLFLPADAEAGLNKKLAFIRKIEDLLNSVQTVVIPDSTHAMMFDHGKEMVKVIREFYQQSFNSTGDYPKI